MSAPVRQTMRFSGWLPGTRKTEKAKDSVPFGVAQLIPG